MAFGSTVRPADSVEPADWLDDELRDPSGVVADLVPDRYDAIVRVHPPEPCEEWWPLYRDVFVAVAGVGERHTTSPERAWIAVWDGHGFDTFSTHRAYRDPPADDDERRQRDAVRDRLRVEDARRKNEVRAALGRFPRFDRPIRTYYLSTGPVGAVGGFEYPGTDGWRNPDLWWPDDRSWFVATDVDMWSLFVAGTTEFVTDVAAAVATETNRVAVDDPLPIED